MLKTEQLLIENRITRVPTQPSETISKQVQTSTEDSYFLTADTYDRLALPLLNPQSIRRPRKTPDQLRFKRAQDRRTQLQIYKYPKTPLSIEAVRFQSSKKQTGETRKMDQLRSLFRSISHRDFNGAYVSYKTGRPRRQIAGKIPFVGKPRVLC